MRGENSYTNLHQTTGKEGKKVWGNSESANPYWSKFAGAPDEIATKEKCYKSRHTKQDILTS
jgi:hypothetical protein